MNKIILSLFFNNLFRLNSYLINLLNIFFYKKLISIKNINNFFKKRKKNFEKKLLKKLIQPKIFILNLEIETKDVINKIYNYENLYKENEFSKDGHKNMYQSEHNLNQHRDFSGITSIIIKTINDKIINFFGDDQKLNITKMWFVITKESGVIQKHSHFESDLSGVVYLKNNEDKKNKNLGSLKIYNIHKNISLYKYNKQENKFNFFKIDDPEYYFSPKINDMILFNSYLEHSVHNSDINNDRISLPFDCEFISGEKK